MLDVFLLGTCVGVCIRTRQQLCVLGWPKAKAAAMAPNANRFHFSRNTVTSPESMFLQKAINQFAAQLDISEVFTAQIVQCS